MNAVEGWHRVDLGSLLALVRNGYSGQQVGRITEFPVSRIETISDGVVDLAKVGFVDSIPDSYLLSVGDILFSIAKENDLGTNLFHGKYSTTHFGTAAKHAYESGQPVYSDMESYAPSNNKIASFLIYPMVDDDENKIGLIAVQLSLDDINEILTEINKAKNKYSWKEIKHRLKGHKIIKNIDEKEKNIIIEI